MRDDALVLFGFENKQEYKLFSLLIGVSGVGPKTAFGVISFSKVNEFVAAVKTNDSSYFTRVPGLGKKTALKIMLELSGKFDSEFVFEPTHLSEDDKMVIDALSSLGFKAGDAKIVLEKIDKTKTTEEKITESIRMLSSK